MLDMISILPPRLRAIARLLPYRCAVADIGTDHALLPVALAISGQARKIIASDSRSGPLASAQATLRRFSCASRVELRCADGLTAFSVGEVDTVVLAGMGATSIHKILTKDRSKMDSLQTIIVQANRGWEFLRCTMADYGFGIVDECLVPEGKHVYVIIKFSQSYENSSLCQNFADVLIGPKIRHSPSPVLRRFLCQEIDRCQHVLQNMQNASDRHDEKRVYLEEKQNMLKSELNRWQPIQES